jgi:hypothetical protein
MGVPVVLDASVEDQSAGLASGKLEATVGSITLIEKLAR